MRTTPCHWLSMAVYPLDSRIIMTETFYDRCKLISGELVHQKHYVRRECNRKGTVKRRTVGAGEVKTAGRE